MRTARIKAFTEYVDKGTSVKVIYVSNKWDMTKSYYSAHMFQNNPALSGTFTLK